MSLYMKKNQMYKRKVDYFRIKMNIFVIMNEERNKIFKWGRVNLWFIILY